MPIGGISYGTGTSRQRHDHARQPNCDTAVEGSAQELATRYGLNSKTVAKWRKRAFAHDARMGPKVIRSTVLATEEKAVIVAFRKHTLLPLDDCLYALQATIPHLTRSSLRAYGRARGARASDAAPADRAGLRS